MKTTSITDYPRDVTFEKVWATLDRITLKQEELTRQMERTEESMGFLSNRFGELAEHLVAPKIHERFNEIGYHFTEMATKGCTIRGENGKTRAEIDLLLQNGDTVMAAECNRQTAGRRGDSRNYIRY